MSLTVGQHVSAAGSGTTLTTGAITTTNKSGLVIGVTYNTAFTSVSDNKGNTWVQIETEIDHSFGTGLSRCYFCASCVGGAGHTFSVTCGTSSGSAIYVQEILASQNTGVSKDQSGRAEDLATPFVSPSETTTVADEFLFAFGIGNSNSDPDTWTAGASFTKQENVTDGTSFRTGASGTRIVTATGTYNSSWTCSSSTQTAQWLATFSENNPILGPFDYTRFPKAPWIGDQNANRTI